MPSPLPGGWVYVTRGLLALANREDEVAGVLAHEMAHVIERHSVRQAGAATPLAMLFGVPSGILGTVSPTLGGIVGGTGASGRRAWRSRRTAASRSARRTGSGSASRRARAGTPAHSVSFLGVLERAEALAGAATSERQSFFATHPSTPERMATIDALARSAPRASEPPMAASRPAFLEPYRRPRGRRQRRPRRLRRPPLPPCRSRPGARDARGHWKTANTPRAAGAVAPEQAAVVLLQVVGGGSDPVAGARADGLTEAQAAKLRRFQISGLPAAGIAATTRDRTYVDLTWIAHRARIFRVTGVCHETDRARYRPIFEQTAATFRPLRPEERTRIVESRLRIRAARAGETVAEVVSRSGATWPPPLAAIANGVSLDRKLETGWPVKVAVTERYRPAPVPAPASR